MAWGHSCSSKVLVYPDAFAHLALVLSISSSALPPIFRSRLRVSILSWVEEGEYVGHTMTYDPSGGSFLNFSGLCGAITGYAIGSTLGSALGVYLIGSSGNETGSFGSTFLGSVLGTGLGIVIVAKSDGLSMTHFIMGSMIQSVGASIGFNLSRRVEGDSAQMVNLICLNF